MGFFGKIFSSFEKKSISHAHRSSSVKESYIDFSPRMANDTLVSARTYRAFSDYGYSQNPIAFRAINIIAHSGSAIPLVLMKCEDCKHYNIDNHDLLKLIQRPNPFMSRVDFIETIIYHLMINGNAYVLKVHDINNMIKELHVLHPSNVDILTNNSNSVVTGYRYQDGGKVKEYLINRLDGSCDVLHIKNFNPTSQIFGLSPFEAAANAIDQHNAAMKWNKSLMRNGAKPSGALLYKSKSGDGLLSEDQRIVLKRELEEHFSGADNSGKPMLLEGGLEWKEMSVSPKDLDFANADKIAMRHIANAFGVPVQLLNDNEFSSYNNYIEAKKSLYENTILPLLNKIIFNVFNNWLCKVFGCEYYVTYREEDIPALSYKKEQILNNIKNSDFLTINEKRAMIGLDPIEGGDRL
jgi:HK97 family phage portal protein